MKTRIVLALALFFGCVPFLTAQNTAPRDADASTLRIVERGRDHRIVEWTTAFTNELGEVTTETRSYTELATGLHYFENDQWIESKELVEAFPDGVIARQGAIKAVFAPNLNTKGAIDVEGPDGKRIRSHLLGLVYRSEKAGQNAVIAKVRDSAAEILGANQVVYRDAMDGAKVTVRYRVARDAIEQDILIEDLPGPEEFGLPIDSHLEAWTELIESPDAQIEERKAGDLSDQLVELGSFSLVAGKAFALSGADRNIAVGKSITDVAGHRYLIETVKFQDVRPLLVRPQAGIFKAKNANLASRVTEKRQAPAPKLLAAASSKKPVTVATAALPERGVNLDYTAVLTSTNYTFTANTTYYIAGQVNLSGTTTVQGLSVIKYTNGAQIKILGGMNWTANQFQPVVMTARDDDSIGEAISGSTSSPAGYYADAALYLDSVTSGVSYNFQNLRVLYAKTGVYFNHGTSNVLRHAQLLNSQKAVQADTSIYSLGNVLFNNNGTNFYGQSYTGRCEHLTVNGVTLLSYDTANTNNSLLCITNSLLVNVTSVGTVPWQTNFIGQATYATNVFLPVSAGNHYLLTNSGFQGLGTTNISSLLLSDLRKRTTIAPALLTNVFASFTIDTQIGPTGLVNLGPSLDIGYYYDPIDYIMTQQGVTDCTLTLKPGVTIAYFGPLISYNSNATFKAVGDPLNPVRIIYRLDAQEQPVASILTNAGFFRRDIIGQGSAGPLIWQFVDFDLRSFCGTFSMSAVGTMSFRDSVFRGGTFQDGGVTNGVTRVMAWTNNLFLGTYLNPLGVTNRFYNNTFIKGRLNLTNFVTITDNIFDQTTINYKTGSYNYNAYTYYPPGTKQFYGGNSPVLTNHVFDVGPLGSYYLPTNCLAINAGSKNATNAGLFHYTTTTNQVKEANSVVDMGFHYVALDANGNPFDTDGDGLYDYREDANGNGSVNSGETDWQSATDLGLRVLITRPKANSPLP